MKIFITLIALSFSTLTLADAKLNQYADLLKKELTPLKIENLKMRQSFDYVTGGTAIVGDIASRFDREFANMYLETDAKRVSFKARLGRQVMNYNCNIVFFTYVENKKRGGGLSIIGCKITPIEKRS